MVLLGSCALGPHGFLGSVPVWFSGPHGYAIIEYLVPMRLSLEVGIILAVQPFAISGTSVSNWPSKRFIIPAGSAQTAAGGTAMEVVGFLFFGAFKFVMLLVCRA